MKGGHRANGREAESAVARPLSYVVKSHSTEDDTAEERGYATEVTPGDIDLSTFIIM